jgi:hypothetical protein
VFAKVDPAGLDLVYVRGSSPWRSDRALLASYRARGLRIEGLRLQISSLQIQRQVPGTPGSTTVVLRVADRLVAGAAVDMSGRRIPLPPGRPMIRLVTLTGKETDWRISNVVAA